MVDNDQNNDEYKFAEMDAFENDPMSDMDMPREAASPSFEREQFAQKKNIKRNALITIAIIVCLMVMYKIIGAMFSSGKKESVSATNIIPVVQAPAQPLQAPITVAPQPIQPVVMAANPDLNKKVSAIELSQESVKAEVNSVSQQVGTVNNNVTNLNNQIAALNQSVSTLAQQVALQAEEIRLLVAHSQPKKMRKPSARPAQQALTYYIQAVIPGRAWLIATNGSTLTVREGTKIAGYGVVKLIDSMQGRVIMSSGRIIRFSQEDS